MHSVILSGARCKLAYSPADANAIHCLLLHLNPDWFCLLVPAHLGIPRQRAVKQAYYSIQLKKPIRYEKRCYSDV